MPPTKPTVTGPRTRWLASWCTRPRPTTDLREALRRDLMDDRSAQMWKALHEGEDDEPGAEPDYVEGNRLPNDHSCHGLRSQSVTC